MVTFEPSVLSAKPLSIDDVLKTVSVDALAISPDGRKIALSIQRPATAGEVYGRESYDVDPSRNDIWTIDRNGANRLNITNGGSAAAGYWCPNWSPDGKWIAMLSTKPEGQEPRGGDNVRLYVSSATGDELHRLSDRAIATQTRYGSPLHRIDIRGEDGDLVAPCRPDEENAPFIWLDNRRILAILMPLGQASPMIDHYTHFAVESVATVGKIRNGMEATFSASNSGNTEDSELSSLPVVQLALIDIFTRQSKIIASIPNFPFNGSLTVALSPDKTQAAILTPVGAIPPNVVGTRPINDGEWRVQKRLGMVNLEKPSLSWISLPDAAKYPLDFSGWSDDGKNFAFRARERADLFAGSLFSVTVKNNRVERMGISLRVGTTEVPEQNVFWIGSKLLVYGRLGDSGEDQNNWWLVDRNAAPVPIPFEGELPPQTLYRLANREIVGFSGRDRVRYEVAQSRLERFYDKASRRPIEGRCSREPKPAVTRRDNALDVYRISVSNSERFSISRSATILASDCDGLIWQEPTQKGVRVYSRSWNGGTSAIIFHLNQHLAGVRWGETRIIDYVGADGSPLKAAVILPPDYIPSHTYPMLVWVYGGYRVRDENDYWLNPYLPGIYNLQLYASLGYVILVPSVPVPHSPSSNDPYPSLTSGVLPAVDKLIALGIADPHRLGLFGQSYGGYSVYGLITQTDRFAAAVGLSGITNMTTFHGTLSTGGRRYPGFEKDASENAVIAETALRFHTTPSENPDLYARSSPITHVRNVKVPLLMIQGEYDSRGGFEQADPFFFELYREGKTARLLHFWGENHSLSLSPANVRQIFKEISGWFDKSLKVTLSR
ncbi:prolyl oligopeptidase family serine peptidase [Sphingobium sp. Sx8-8]|uniref:S9 family peptidase n=1 Tax=Sphingobium sp. Sx8-8 TaxID=2933617 RepID=UPI001F566EF9